MEMSFDFSQFRERVGIFKTRVEAGAAAGVIDIAYELLRLSQKEVPLDEGTLQNSGTVEPDGADMLVGYNTPYAAYQHEGQRKDGSHQIKHYQHGRKGKFLEDPMNKNKDVFEEHYYMKITEALSA